MNDIEYGYCKCGCGGKTNISKWTDKRLGSVKGEPRSFINGHSTKVPSIKRFWKYVKITQGCWEWSGYIGAGGYGVISSDDGKLMKAHRLSWSIKHGPIPDGLKVCHKCDNPKCVNPSHLFLGTQSDNVQDCKKKGRISNRPQPGESNPMSRLTNKQVLDMRSLRLSRGLSYKKIGQKFGVAAMTAYRAITGQSWGTI